MSVGEGARLGPGCFKISASKVWMTIEGMLVKFKNVVPIGERLRQGYVRFGRSSPLCWSKGSSLSMPPPFTDVAV
jgi:hypothetical protein